MGIFSLNSQPIVIIDKNSKSVGKTIASTHEILTILSTINMQQELHHSFSLKVPLLGERIAQDQFCIVKFYANLTATLKSYNNGVIQ
ncbi:hypothetical protein RJ46_04220 [Vibrio sinaloensis]|nr:hypothetical protein RJ46_04220 [Vibrio sinaloensis]